MSRCQDGGGGSREIRTPDLYGINIGGDILCGIHSSTGLYAYGEHKPKTNICVTVCLYTQQNYRVSCEPIIMLLLSLKVTVSYEVRMHKRVRPDLKLNLV